MNTPELDKIKILYVDDEPENLRAFVATFRRKYEIHTATSVAEGMAVLNEHEIEVIVADQRMPKTTGVEFFNIIRKAYPDPARILITGYTDMEAMIDAINKGEIFRYLKKPWDENELHAAIKNAYEVYKTRKKLNEKIIELQRANDELNRFVYSTSHDLRSPLANIMAILSLIKVEQSVSDPNNYLQMIETSVARMDLFIHKIIEYYKSSRVEEINENVDFNKLIQDSIDVSKHNNPKINFIKQIEQKSTFKGDSFRIAIIINNLISNAVKYQKPDEENQWIKISVAVDEKNAHILIEDNGVGIIESHLNNIFKMFFRSIDLSKGLGIGLYIVKEALNKIGGDISVSSTIGKGTSFALILPNKNYAPMYEMFE